MSPLTGKWYYPGDNAAYGILTGENQMQQLDRFIIVFIVLLAAVLIANNWLIDS